MAAIHDHLQRIYDQHGKLTPELVVETARPKSHPLHAHVFSLDRGEAAEAWYLYRARELITRVRIVYKEDPESGRRTYGRAYHRDGVSPERGVYRPAEEVAMDPRMRDVLIADMQREWKALYRRFADFQEFVAMVKADLDDADGEAA